MEPYVAVEGTVQGNLFLDGARCVKSFERGRDHVEQVWEEAVGCPLVLAPWDVPFMVG